MLSPRDILARAVVPEHSVPFMQAISGGRALVLVAYDAAMPEAFAGAV